MTETDSYKVITDLYQDRDKFVSVAFRYLQNTEKARDVFSNSFASLLEKKDTLPDDPVKLRVYLMQTVKHKCLNELKHDMVRQKRENIYRMDSSLLADDNVTRNIIEKDIVRLLGDASLKMNRQAFDIYISSRFDGMSHKELAELYGITPNKVAKEIMKAGKIIERAMMDYLKIIIILLLS